MANVLFLAHRLPYPPNKGDKVRSYHLLKHLAERHRVSLGTFVDDPADEQHVPRVRAMCADVHVSRLRPWLARIRSARGLLTREPLSVAYYRDAGMHEWAGQLWSSHAIDAVLVFSSSMLQYAQRFSAPTVVDFADVESEKWAEYGRSRRGAMAWVYRREGPLLRTVERQGAAQASCSLFATETEAQLFRELAPESAHKVEVLGNGVDAAYFAPLATRTSPFAADEVPVVFVGTMDYWPNVDAVCWLVAEMLPKLRRRWPALRLHVVGRNPTPAILRLASDAVSITGTVGDVRPYLQHARAVVAPVRLARGIQNKVLEAMAMGRPVLATLRCAQAIDAKVGEHLLVADDADAFVRGLDALLASPASAEAIGSAARAQVLAKYSWASRMAGLERHFPAHPQAAMTS